ncbi:MAG: hypothetical protein ABI563_14865, partial [Specibacter sp.]
MTAALISLLLSACLFTSHYRPEPAALQDAVDCSVMTGTMASPTDPGVSLKGRVPDGFVPSDAVLCTWEFPVPAQPATTDPHPIINIEHLSGDYSPLLAALAESSDRGGRGNCLANMENLPELWLVNAAGKTVRVDLSSVDDTLRVT